MLRGHPDAYRLEQGSEKLNIVINVFLKRIYRLECDLSLPLSDFLLYNLWGVSCFFILAHNIFQHYKIQIKKSSCI